MGHQRIDVESLTPEQRLDLLERLWDSLDPAQVPVTPAQIGELDRRLDELDRDLAKGRVLGIPWDEVLKPLQDR